MTQKARLSSVDRNQLLYSLITLILSLVFSVTRAIQGDFLFASLMILPIAVALFVMWAVSRQRSVDYRGTLFCTVVLASIVGAVYLRGPDQLVWVFPAIFAPGFIVPPATARVLSISTFVAIIPAAFTGLPLFEFVRYEAALLTSMFFALIVARGNAREADHLKALARLDPLTQVGNRRSLERAARSIIEGDAKSYCLAIIDLDWFKKINDQHGHLKGDQVLQSFCRVAKTSLPSNVRLFRFGGEEFIALLPYDIGDSMEHIQSLLEHTLAYDFGLGYDLSFSAGVADLQRRDFEQWLSRADEVLFDAKHDGRCRVYRASA